MNVRPKLRKNQIKGGKRIINNTRILIDDDKLYIIADTKNIPTREDFLAECLKHYQLSNNEISINDIEVKHVTIQSVIKESQSEDGASQRIQKKYRFSKLGTTVYALELKWIKYKKRKG